VSFWVHIGSGSSPDLKLFFTNVSYTFDYTFLGLVSGPQGSAWRQFEFKIGAHPANYQLEIMGDPIDADTTEIGIDDVQLKNCAVVNPATTKTTSPPTRTTQTLGPVTTATAPRTKVTTRETTTLAICSDIYCLNNGLCYISSTNNLECKCVQGFTGERCQLKLSGNQAPDSNSEII
jgi:hypothetical protein